MKRLMRRRIQAVALSSTHGMITVGSCLGGIARYFRRSGVFVYEIAQLVLKTGKGVIQNKTSLALYCSSVDNSAPFRNPN